MPIKASHARGATGTEPVRTRIDPHGKVHRVASVPCEECGCPFDYSLDALGILWEPGLTFQPGCLDRTCMCHTSPIRGADLILHVR
jgi:hypothetical protein